MKKTLLLICPLIIVCIEAISQDKVQVSHYDGKYFKYSVGNTMMIAMPLFNNMPNEKQGLLLAEFDYSERHWIEKVKGSIIAILKKYYTTKEIEEMRSPDGRKGASIYVKFDYYGNIKHLYFAYQNRLKHLFTDEKLYNLYQDLIKLKLDTSQLYWFVRGIPPTPEQLDKIFSSTQFYLI